MRRVLVCCARWISLGGIWLMHWGGRVVLGERIANHSVSFAVRKQSLF